MKNLEIQPYVDLRPELEQIKCKKPQQQAEKASQTDEKTEKLGEVVKEKDPVDLLEN